jgi:hypothetical protein
MFTAQHLQTLLAARPFVPFRLVLSDGSAVEVRTPELAYVARSFAIVGILDAETSHTLTDRFTIAYYMHVARVDYLSPGAPPFSSPSGPSQPSPRPSPV